MIIHTSTKPLEDSKPTGPPLVPNYGIFPNMRIEALQRLVTGIIQKPDLNSGQKRLGDYVMDYVR